MTRILYWNIENFNLNTLGGAPHTQLQQRQLQQRQQLIEQIITHHIPDIIVIVEVTAPRQPNLLDGLTVSGPGAQGALHLLINLRNHLGNHWMLVPPLYSGDRGFREGVAVYYNRNNLNFRGPYVWCDPPVNPPDIHIPRARPNNAQNRQHLGNYPPRWNGCLPADRMHNDINENQYAGKFRFFDAHNRQIGFPIGLGYINKELALNRSPFLTTFFEPGNNRTIKLFAVHTSPTSAQEAVRNLALIPDIISTGDEVSVIVGDFNVDSFNHFNVYNDLLNQRLFTIHLDPRNNQQGNPDNNRRPYCITHILPVNRATAYNTPHTPVDQAVSPGGAYPKFGYMGSMGGWDFQQVVDTAAIDNVFTLYGFFAGGPANNMTVINPVVGSPYNGNHAPQGAPLGHYNYPQCLNNPLPAQGAIRGGIPGRTVQRRFLQYQNYGKIRATSDHLPLIIDV